MKKLAVIFFICFLMQHNIRAQQEAMLSQYMYSGLYYNPAFSGTRQYTEINGIFRKQWVNFDGAPTTELLSAEGPVKNKNMGWGAILVNDQIGISCRTDMQLNYSYQIKTGDEYRLSFGLRGGVNYYRAQLSNLKVWEENDAVFNINIKNIWLPNAGAGLFFYSRNFYSGLSCPNLINYSKDINNFSKERLPRIVPHYYLTAGVNIETDKEIDIRPSLLLKYVSDAPLQADISLIVDLKKILSLGTSYRTGDGLVAMMQILLSEKWRVGYSYDYPLTRLNQYSYGTHEFMLGYKIKTTSKSVSSF
jgi:type IX secretion system PorP/SprF family membrane protein